MGRIVLCLLLTGCADKPSVEQLKQDMKTLSERIAKLEAQAASHAMLPEKKEQPEKQKGTEKDDASIEGNAALIAAMDRKLSGIPSSVGLKFDDLLDEHGRIRDLKFVAATIKEKIGKRGGGDEGEWRLLSTWLGVQATAAIMNGTAMGSSGEEIIPADRALAAMEQYLLSENAGIVASNLGFKLSESIGTDGHLKNPRAMCTRIHNWHMKRGEQGHSMLLESYGRFVGSEIWTGALCQAGK